MKRKDKEQQLLSDSELQKMSYEELMRHQDAVWRAVFGKSLSDSGITNLKVIDHSNLLSSFDYSKNAPVKHPPKKENQENDLTYCCRLRYLWGQDNEVKIIHKKWMGKIERTGYSIEPYLKQRIIDQLGIILKSGFLCKDYIDTGMPREECEAARQKCEEEGWDKVLDVEGAEWKLALLLRHLVKAPEKRLLCDDDNVGYYIDDMCEKLSWDDVEVFFRFDAFMRLVYAEFKALENGKDFEDEDEGEEENNKFEEVGCPQVFDKRLNEPIIITKINNLNSDDVIGKRRWYVFYRVFKFLEWTKVTQQTFIAWVAFHFGWDKKQEFRGVPPEFTNNDPPKWGTLVIETKVKDEKHYNYELGQAYSAFAVDIRDAFVTVDESGEMHDKEDFLVGPQKKAIAHHKTWK